MEIEILSKDENQLLERLELKFKAVHVSEGTPNREDVREKLASMIKVPKERVVVDAMNSEFGKSETVGYAKAYKTKEAALRYEREHVLIRNKLKERVRVGKKPAAEEPAPPAPPAPSESAPDEKQEKK